MYTFVNDTNCLRLCTIQQGRFKVIFINDYIRINAIIFGTFSEMLSLMIISIIIVCLSIHAEIYL